MSKKVKMSERVRVPKCKVADKSERPVKISGDVGLCHDIVS